MTSRSTKQNNSLHKFCELLAHELNSAGLDMREVLKPSVDIPWSKDAVKEFIWKPIQKSMNLKKSTTELTTKEVGEVYEVINRHISEKFGIHVDWPHIE